jgi:uridine kinase
MHTIIRDATSSKNDFVFYADRLNRLIVEAGLGHLPFTEKIVKTPTGAHTDPSTHCTCSHSTPK